MVQVFSTSFQDKILRTVEESSAIKTLLFLYISDMLQISKKSFAIELLKKIAESVSLKL